MTQEDDRRPKQLDPQLSNIELPPFLLEINDRNKYPFLETTQEMRDAGSWERAIDTMRDINILLLQMPEYVIRATMAYTSHQKPDYIELNYENVHGYTITYHIRERYDETGIIESSQFITRISGSSEPDEHGLVLPPPAESIGLQLSPHTPLSGSCYYSTNRGQVSNKLGVLSVVGEWGKELKQLNPDVLQPRASSMVDFLYPNSEQQK